MPDRQKVLKALYAAVDQLNEESAEDKKLTKTEDTVVFGKRGKLDSLGLVNLLVIAEQKLSDEFEQPVSLADERAMSQERSPFRTIGTMADYASKLLEEKGEPPSSPPSESSLPAPVRESANI